MTGQVITFGCRLNTFESQVIKSNLEQLKDPNVVVFNSCTVTKEAERQVCQAIRKAKRENPEARIIVTGCAAQIHPERFLAMKEVDKVIGNKEKFDLDSYTNHDRALVGDIMTVKETAHHLVSAFDGHSRAFVQIQNGCNHRCTFCIIPYGRGNSRSVPVEQVCTHIGQLVHKGYKEVVLTGVDISDYGKDLPGTPTLGEMIKRVLITVPNLKRLRLSSIDVAEIDETLFGLITDEERLMPHLHISLQAGDDLILKRMKRRHTRDDVIHFCHKVRQLRSDIAFGADIIAGFPTETDAMFENTRALIQEADLQYLHVFPYSARTGTPAARMPQIPLAIRKERAKRLREEGQKNLHAFLHKQIGTTQQVIVEKPTFARAENFMGVTLRTPVSTGELIKVNIVAVDGDQTIGEVVT